MKKVIAVVEIAVADAMDVELHRLF